jgi:hypothetical protein
VVFPARTLALIVLGSTGVSAWGQVDAPSTGKSVPVAAATVVPAPMTTSVASFPDVVERKPRRNLAPTHDLLDGNPYGGELESQEKLFGLSIDDDNPYAEQERLAKPYSLELRLRSPYASRKDVSDPDFENPYGKTTALATKPRLEPDFENPYAGR